MNTGRHYERQLGSGAIAAGVIVLAGAMLFDLPTVVAAVLAGNAAVCIWWGVNLLVTHRPW